MTELAEYSRRVRAHILRMATGPEGTHVGGALSCTDILTTLYFAVLRVRPHDPDWPDRDHFLLSKGHASAALYATLAEAEYFPVEELATYACRGSRLGGHPTRKVPGVELPTGSLGHGLSLGVGLALAARGTEKRCYVLLGDGELQEGAVWEAAASAGFLKLDHLVAVVDGNQLQLNGSSEQRSGLAGLDARWASLGWVVRHVDGHNLEALTDVLRSVPAERSRPTVVLARTVKGRGVGFLESRAASHYAKFDRPTYERALAALALSSGAQP